LDKKNKLKERSWEAYEKWSGSCVFFSGKKEENECVRRKLIPMCEIMLFMEKCVQTKSMEGSCV
jgi:hypothetical protein